MPYYSNYSHAWKQCYSSIQVNLHKTCPFWPNDNRCALKDCSVDVCSEEEIPIGLKGFKVGGNSFHVSFSLFLDNAQVIFYTIPCFPAIFCWRHFFPTLVRLHFPLFVLLRYSQIFLRFKKNAKFTRYGLIREIIFSQSGLPNAYMPSLVSNPSFTQQRWGCLPLSYQGQFKLVQYPSTTGLSTVRH